jgi:hypothetical protein
LDAQALGAGETSALPREEDLSLKRKRRGALTEDADADDADDAGSDSIMTCQPGHSEGAGEVNTSARGGGGGPRKSRSGRSRERREDRPKKDQSAADILVSIANA